MGLGLVGLGLVGQGSRWNHLAPLGAPLGASPTALHVTRFGTRASRASSRALVTRRRGPPADAAVTGGTAVQRLQRLQRLELSFADSGAPRLATRGERPSACARLHAFLLSPFPLSPFVLSPFPLSPPRLATRGDTAAVGTRAPACFPRRPAAAPRSSAARQRRAPPAAPAARDEPTQAQRQPKRAHSGCTRVMLIDTRKHGCLCAACAARATWTVTGAKDPTWRGRRVRGNAKATATADFVWV